MKSPDDIQRAHDILVAFVLEDVPDVVLSDADQILACLAGDVLCWVLDHKDHSSGFKELLLELEAKAFAKGYVLTDHGKPEIR